MKPSLFQSRLLSGLIVVCGLLVSTSCYAPDVSRLLYRCQGSDPCPSGMECRFGLCVATDIIACASGIGVWLTEDDYKALCPAIGAVDLNSCSADYEPDKNCPEEASVVCNDPVAMTTNKDCFRCCLKK